jgi:hypothetical protein
MGNPSLNLNLDCVELFHLYRASSRNKLNNDNGNGAEQQDVYEAGFV